MSTVLPYVNERWALARIITAPSFGSTWTVQPMWRKGRRGYGFEVLNFSRVALPAVGEARLRYRFGRIDSELVGVIPQSTVASMAAGNGFSAATDTVNAPDLRGQEVRIQLAPWVADGETPAWFTAWWGQIEYQADTFWPGSDVPAGERIYHCADGFARTRRWPMNRHSVYAGGKHYPHSPGHPGYNVSDGAGLRGNCSGVVATHSENGDIPDDTDLKYLAHTWPGTASSTPWSDKQAIEHALRIGRGKGDPLFDLYGNGNEDNTDPLRLYSQGVSAWTVNEQESAFDFVSRACRRQRGRGLVFVDWADDTLAPTDPLSVRLTVNPQVAEDLEYSTWSTPASASLPGAALAGTATTVDLIGDHRAEPESFSIGDRDQARYDCVESLGERIELLATLSSLDGTLANRWLAGMQTAFLALSARNRTDESWFPVYQTYGLPRSWGLNLKDHNSGATVGDHRCDYRCDDTGAVSTPPPLGQTLDTSPLKIEVLPDLPLLEGYTYTTAPPALRSAGAESGTPNRRPPLALIRTAANRYIAGDEIPNGRGLTIQVGSDTVLLHARTDQALGTRVIGNTATSSLASIYNTSALGITVGLRLPHRVRMMDYAPGITSTTSKRKLTIQHSGLHLWLADAGAIWDLDATTRSGSTGCTPLRRAVGAAVGAPGLLRDDRAALGILHALACSWYLTNRRTATWTLKACGFLPTFSRMTDLDTEAVTTQAFPGLGQLVTSISAGGQANALGTPITSVSYDHQRGATTWATDWAELDFQ